MRRTSIRLFVAAFLLTPLIAPAITEDDDDFKAIVTTVKGCTSGGDSIDHNDGQYLPDQGTIVLMTEYTSGVISAATLQLASVSSVTYDGIALKIECDTGDACIRVTNGQRRSRGIHIDSQRRQDSFKFLGCDDRGSRRIEQLFNRN